MLQIKYDVIFKQLRGVSELWRFIVEATKHKRMKSQGETCCQATVMPLWGGGGRGQDMDVTSADTPVG